jgi:CheY-like chemotaxis protein
MGRHILLIEDEDEVRESMMQVLELEGFEVTTAGKGDEALEQMRALEVVDAILLDLMMPGMSGRQVRERQLEEGLLVDAPVIVLSGTSGDLEPDPEELRAVDRLDKPVRANKLCDTLETYMSGSRGNDVE